MRLLKTLWMRFESPLWLHHSAYLSSGLLVWGGLLIAGVSRPIALAAGALVGVAAEILAELAWRRCERADEPLSPSQVSRPNA
jgi:hypothetical protein